MSLSSASSPASLVLCRPAQAADPVGNLPGEKTPKVILQLDQLPEPWNCSLAGEGMGQDWAWQQQQTAQVLLYWEQGDLSLIILNLFQNHFIFPARSTRNGWGQSNRQESVWELSGRDPLGGGM